MRVHLYFVLLASNYRSALVIVMSYSGTWYSSVVAYPTNSSPRILTYGLLLSPSCQWPAFCHSAFYQLPVSCFICHLTHAISIWSTPSTHLLFFHSFLCSLSFSSNSVSFNVFSPSSYKRHLSRNLFVMHHFTLHFLSYSVRTVS